MSNKSRSNPPWSEIPPEILLMIGELTGYQIHRSRIPAVCKLWRSAFADVENRRIKSFPLKIPNHPSLGFDCFDLDRKSASLFIVPTTSYVIQPTNGSLKGSSLLVTVDVINPGYVSPRYPLSLSIGNPTKGLDLLENRVTFVNPGFSLRLLHVRGNVTKKDGRENELRYFWREKSEKAVVCKNPCCDNDLLVMVLCYEDKLMALRVRDGEWKTVFDGKVSKCHDVVKFKDVIYGIDHLGGAFLIDYNYGNGDANVVSVAPSVEDGGEKPKRLVVDSSSNETLYMVILRPWRSSISFSSVSFLVYRLNEELGVWEKIKSIGDRMFFVGVNFSFCATSHDFPGLAMSCIRSLPQNCIFFSKGSFPRRNDEDGDDGDNLLFGKNNIAGTGMNIGQYYLNARRATRILEPAFVTMFSHPI